MLALSARVVEFGPGWGNSTLTMAMAGLDVTAVDVEPSHVAAQSPQAPMGQPRPLV
jgi:predicted O-methyltransferase YrrM